MKAWAVLLAVYFARLVVLAGDAPRFESLEDKMMARASRIVIPQLDFNNVTFAQALEVLRREARENDPDHVGIKIEDPKPTRSVIFSVKSKVTPPPGGWPLWNPLAVHVTLSVRNLSVVGALQALSQFVEGEVISTPTGLSVVQPSDDDILTRTIPLAGAPESEIKKIRANPRQYFIDKGAIFFDRRSSCTIQPDGSVLVVTGESSDVWLVEMVFESFCDEIHQAVKDGDILKVKALLDTYPALVSSKDCDTRGTPLHWAAAAGETEVTQSLLAKKADVNARDEDGMTPLHCAANREVAELLIVNKADVNARDAKGMTPLHSAVSGGNKEVVEVLLANKADVNAVDAKGMTPLHLAAAAGETELTRLLLAKKADVNARDGDGITPLHCAANREVAELLLVNKADINARDAKGMTPLHSAVSAECEKVAELLLANGADVNSRDMNGMTPLHHAVSTEHLEIPGLPSMNKPEIIKLLLANKADINARDNRGETPLRLALATEEENVVDLLRARGGGE